MEAWRLADDMNDAIDDFILSLKRSNARHFIQEKIQPSLFQDLKRRADDVWEECRKKWKKMDTAHTTFSSLFLRSKTTAVDSDPGKWRHRVGDPYVHKDISDLVGMEEPRDKLIKHLVEEEESTPQLKVASILGAAGMGKTSLARLVYEALEEKFDARAFVSVTSSHNMTEVLARIYQQVQGLADSSTVVPLAGTKAATAEEHLIGVMSNFLRDKRYLVIIDDIWHYKEWEIIKKSLPENYLGSRIVTTSRVNAITDKWRDDFGALVHQIGYREYRDRPGLTNKMIKMNLDMLGEYFDRDHPIVEMCRGMPLAVACMFSALAKERERKEQEGLRGLNTPALQGRVDKQVNRNGIQNTPGFEPLVESLEFGYKDLPHHMLKTCLLYCSIYANGHQCTRDDLVRRWIAQGFVCKEEVGKDYFDELVSRGFFSKNPVDFYEMHPMMQTYLRWKLREDNFITCTSDGVPSSPVGRLCIDYWPNNAVDTLSGIDWHHIRCLVVLEYVGKVPYKHLQHLRVLDIRSKWDLENQHFKDICGLLRLRHLLLVSGSHGWKGITEMPAEIARLQHLEILEVHRTRITRLPAEIGDLKQLKTLDLALNQELAELPREMGKLQHILETLRISHTKIREQAWEIIGTLKKLKTLDLSWNDELSGIPRDIGELQQLKDLNLMQDPKIPNLRGTGITDLPKEIGKLQHLETLNLHGTKIKELPREIGDLQRLQILDLGSVRSITKLPRDIGKLQHLETLNLHGTEIKELPREIGNLQRLQILDLGSVSTITKLPRDIGKLQHLEALNLSSTNVRIPREIGGLKKLKNLDTDFGILPFEAGQLSKLERLPMWVRRAWKNSDLVSSLAGENLLFDTTGTIGDGGLTLGTKHMHIPKWIKEPFNNIGSLDIRICKLDEEQDLKILREMPYLQSLRLRFEAVPRKPIVINSGGFAKLTLLTVDSRVPRIIFQEGAMPTLKFLAFQFQFYGGPPNTDPPMGIRHLVRLEWVNFHCNEWYRADSPCISAMIDVIRKEAREHRNRIVLKVADKDDEIFPANSITQSSQDRNDEACSSSGGGAQEIEEIQA